MSSRGAREGVQLRLIRGTGGVRDKDRGMVSECRDCHRLKVHRIYYPAR